MSSKVIFKRPIPLIFGYTNIETFTIIPIKIGVEWMPLDFFRKENVCIAPFFSVGVGAYKVKSKKGWNPEMGDRSEIFLGGHGGVGINVLTPHFLMGVYLRQDALWNEFKTSNGSEIKWNSAGIKVAIMF